MSPRSFVAAPRRLVAAALWAVALALGACTSKAPPTFDLSAPRDIGSIGPARGQLAVSEPLTVQAFDSDRIIVKDPSGAITYLGGAQLADRVPRLVQTRLIETFENAGRVGSVGRPGDGVSADTVLATEIRAFEISAATKEASVAITARLIGASGRVIAARLFSARAPVDAIDGPNASQALDRALGEVMIQIVRWVPASRA